MGTTDWNLRAWDDPATWAEDGDEWQFHATACGQPYVAWKRSVVEHFVDPYVGPDVHLIEIGPGHGRWTEHMVDRVGTLTLVDLSPTCIEHCRARFAGGRPRIRFVANDGRSLPVVGGSVDVVWSFGTFVHLLEPEIDAYLAEIHRVLRPGGRFFVHHAGWEHWTLALAPILPRLGRAGRGTLHRMAQGRWRRALDRGPMSARQFATLAAGHGLAVDEQLRTWGNAGRYGLAVRDVLTLGHRP